MIENPSKKRKLAIVNNEMISSSIKIQSFYRGYYVRQILLSQNDNMSYELLTKLLCKYNENLTFIKTFNELLSKKKIRNENFPSHISENIAKFAISKKYNIMPNWDTDKGYCY